MHSREDWVLLQLGPQHKHIERPVWPNFPDYPFLVTMIAGFFLVFGLKVSSISNGISNKAVILT